MTEYYIKLEIDSPAHNRSIGFGEEDIVQEIARNVIPIKTKFVPSAVKSIRVIGTDIVRIVR